MEIEPEFASASIVLIGSFNPRIVHPDWFLRVRLFSQSEYEAAAVEVVTPELAQLKMDWLSIRAQTSRVVAETTQEPYVRLSDLVVAMFGEHLPHTPISALGINYQCHIPLPSLEAADKIGNALAPHDPWGAFASRLQPPPKTTDQSKRGGLVSITMVETADADLSKGRLQVTVESSNRVRPGIYIRTNLHFDIDKDVTDGAQRAASIVRDKFEATISDGKKLVASIIDIA